jgi:hypothetical protein
MPLMPLRSNSRQAVPSSAMFPGWPARFEGKTLIVLPLSEREKRFGSDFPGQIGRFTDGEHEVIIRWVTAATRKLHSASDCFEGIGFRVQPLPLHVDGDGLLWATFIATRGSERLRVYERIYADTGESWPDVSAWYWAAAREHTAGPWWAVTVAEQVPETTP